MRDDHLLPETLYAYDDGLLSDAERLAVERHLATCAECQARLARSIAMLHQLKREFGSTRAPESLRKALREQIDARERRGAIWSLPSARAVAYAFIATIALVFFVAILVVSFRWNGANALVMQLTEAHRGLAQDPQRILMRGDVTELTMWLDDHVHERIELPTPEGFTAIGGLAERIDGQLAAHVLYRQANSTTLSLFVWRGDLSTGNLTPREVNGGQFYVGTQGAWTVVLWRERDLNYACVGDVAPDVLLEMAARIWRSDVN